MIRRAAEFRTRWSLSVIVIGERARTELQKSTRDVTKAWTSVFTDSMSSERRTRLNWRSQKKHDLQTLETCLSRLRSSALVLRQQLYVSYPLLARECTSERISNRITYLIVAELTKTATATFSYYSCLRSHRMRFTEDYSFASASNDFSAELRIQPCCGSMNE